MDGRDAVAGGMRGRVVVGEGVQGSSEAGGTEAAKAGGQT